MTRGASTLLIIFLITFAGIAEASFYGDSVSGQLSDPFTTQLFANDDAVVGDGEEFTGSFSCCGGSTLQYYANIGQTSVTIGVRHLGPFGFVFNANPFTFEFSGLDWGGAGEVRGFELSSVYVQTLWPEGDPNSAWTGWGQDTPTPPPWDPQWDAATGTLTVVASEGYTIPPNFDVFATFDAVVPIPASLPLLVSALGLLALLGSNRHGRSPAARNRGV